MTIEKIQKELLFAALPHVAFDGWTETALRAGAKDIGIDPALAANAFPGGAAALIRYFSDEIDRQMVTELAALKLPTMSVRERVASAVRLRLAALEPHREAVRRGLGFFALPQNTALGVACLYRTVDAIWFTIGDKSTDYNFYTKRLLLAGVYSSTVLFWLNDHSPGYEDTWTFLNRRIDPIAKTGRRIGKTIDGLLNLPDRLLQQCRRFQARR